MKPQEALTSEQAEERVYCHITPENAPQVAGDNRERHTALAQRLLEDLPDGCAEISVGLCSCCLSKGSSELYDALISIIAKIQSPIKVTQRAGCADTCYRTPMVKGTRRGEPCVLYASGADENISIEIEQDDSSRNSQDNLEEQNNNKLAELSSEHAGVR